MNIPDKALKYASEQCREMLDRHAISSDATMYDALVALNALSGSSLTLFALDGEGKFVGPLTDGDIRRALIGGAKSDDSVMRAVNQQFLALTDSDDPFDIFSKAKARHIRMLPHLREGFICEIHDLKSIKALLPLDAVLMAGGRGERLRPLTLERPKPLLPVGGKAIIDYNVEELADNGIRNIFVTVNYLKEQIIMHFAEKKTSARIECVAEPKRMGTIGSLSLVAPQLTHDNILLMNSDLLTTLDYASLYRHHIETGADVTIAAVPYIVSVPYAIMHTDGPFITGLEEKPTFNYFANGGVYILRRELIERIRPDEYLDAPDFIDSLLADGKRVAYFPIEGIWIDVGSPDDYKYADNLMSRKGK
ncbi:MAG: NTP transferase domain-containing protein [Muribaculaceae bacterium]|nr:NTP transferase domain-containing protein [Muribaculaceae bacterium]